MIGLVGLIALITILGLSLVITRLATQALMLTGLSYEAARFQARSAFTGTGFTTREAETVVDHPVRRRIIMAIMLLRSAGIISIILSLILSFVGDGDVAKLTRLAWLAGSVIVLWLISRSRAIDRIMKHIMRLALKRWTNLDVRDYVGLLKLSGDYVIRELHIRPGDWLADRTISACDLQQEGMTILGVYRRNGRYVGVPTGDTEIQAGDTVVVYGRAKALEQLDQRRSGGEGDREHHQSISDQQQHAAQQERQERRDKRTVSG